MSVNPLLEKLEAAIDRAMAFGSPGDEVLMVLAGNSDPWLTGDNTATSVTLVVPADDDFFAETLNIYLEARKIDQDDPEGNGTDLTFRPSMWVTTDNKSDDYGVYCAQDANATFKMTDTFNGTYQGGTGLSIACAYSCRYGQGPVTTETPISAWPGGRDFFVPHKIRRGGSITIGVTPTFSRKVNATIKTQFRVGVVLSGHKVVRRAA